MSLLLVPDPAPVIEGFKGLRAGIEVHVPECKPMLRNDVKISETPPSLWWMT